MRIYLFYTVLFLFFLVNKGVSQPQKMGKVSTSLLSEISGIIPSSSVDGCFWVHNDSGDKAQIYLIDTLANLKLVLKLDGINVVDCEDIARVIIDDQSYILLADIGNNLKRREWLNIYMFPEPKVDFLTKVLHVPSDQIKTITFKYADKKRDAEAIFVDQRNQEVYIISKRDFKSQVFSFRLSEVENSSNITLNSKLSLPFTFTTAADMSLDGKYIIVKNLTNIYLWDHKPNESIIESLSKPYVSISYKIEPQGEAICFDLKNRYFYTISERPFGLESYLYKYIY